MFGFAGLARHSSRGTPPLLRLPPPPEARCCHDWNISGITQTFHTLDANHPRRGEAMWREITVYQCAKCKLKTEVLTRAEIITKQHSEGRFKCRGE